MTQVSLTKTQTKPFEDFLLNGPTSHTVLRKHCAYSLRHGKQNTSSHSHSRRT